MRSITASGGRITTQQLVDLLRGARKGARTEMPEHGAGKDCSENQLRLLLIELLHRDAICEHLQQTRVMGMVRVHSFLTEGVKAVEVLRNGMTFLMRFRKVRRRHYLYVS